MKAQHKGRASRKEILNTATKQDVEQIHSDKAGMAGTIESSLRRFKNMGHALLLLPLYSVMCLVLGLAISPAVFIYRTLDPYIESLTQFQRYLGYATLLPFCYLIYGFSLILVVPFMNWLMRAQLKPWRGQYYSLDSIRWYIHNGLTYLVRYTFLEFITPTPYNIMFYRMMGMKIGYGVALNTTHISDPSMIEIGDKATIGGSVTIVGHYGQGGFLVLAPVKIGRKVTLGLRATVMGGAQIGDNAKILPNSVVLPKTIIPPDEVWGGVPAQKIK